MSSRGCDRFTLTCICSLAWRTGESRLFRRVAEVFGSTLVCAFMRCSSDDMDGPVEDIGSRSCVTRFVKTLLSIMEHGVKPHSKHLTEYFAFLYEFAKMGEEEVRPFSLTHTNDSLFNVLLINVLLLCASRASSCCLYKPFLSWSTSTWELKAPTT